MQENKVEQTSLMNNYGERSIMMDHGSGVHLYDSSGKKYLDFISGLGVNNLGHCHPSIVGAIQQQSEQLIHCCNLYLIENQIRLAEKLVENSNADKVFFCNSGSRVGPRPALKIARLSAWKKDQKEKVGFIAMDKSFHGRTTGAMSLSAPQKVREGFEPALPDIRFARFN